MTPCIVGAKGRHETALRCPAARATPGIEQPRRRDGGRGARSRCARRSSGSAHLGWRGRRGRRPCRPAEVSCRPAGANNPSRDRSLPARL